MCICKYSLAGFLSSFVDTLGCISPKVMFLTSSSGLRGRDLIVYEEAFEEYELIEIADYFSLLILGSRSMALNFLGR
jgi:hypothetical protein